MTQDITEKLKKYVNSINDTLVNLPAENIARVIALLKDARLEWRTVFIFDTGGSTATASHFACDLSKGAIADGKAGFRAISLTDNVDILTAWANDSSYDQVFAEQLENHIGPGEVAIGISGSGNSPNVLNGIKMAKSKGATTVGSVGFDGGKLKDLVDIPVVAPLHDMEQAEDIHLILGHFITACLRGNS